MNDNNPTTPDSTPRMSSDPKPWLGQDGKRYGRDEVVEHNGLIRRTLGIASWHPRPKITGTARFQGIRDTRPGDATPWQHRHYLVTLSNDHRSSSSPTGYAPHTVATPFSRGMMLDPATFIEPVTQHGHLTTEVRTGYVLTARGVADVLCSLIEDYRTTVDCDTFAEFCDEYGYDTDSRRAEAVWRSLRRLAPRLRTFFTLDQRARMMGDADAEDLAREFAGLSA